MRIFLRAALFVLLFPAIPAGHAATVHVERDVAYLEPERAEKLDVYLPPARFQRPVPAVLLIHGGGWREGDKASTRERSIGETLAAEGYAVFSINYLLNLSEPGADGKPRLTRLAWPQNIIDCKTALRFMRAEADRFGIDPKRVAVMGGSAGAHLAMLVATGKGAPAFDSAALYPGQPDGVSCIINLYGPWDVRGRSVSPFADSTLSKEARAAVDEAASPSSYLNANMPPMLIVHGTADRIVPVQQSRDLAARLQKLGVDYWYIEIAGAPHTFNLQPKQMDLRPVVLGFLEKHLGAGADATSAEKSK